MNKALKLHWLLALGLAQSAWAASASAPVTAAPSLPTLTVSAPAGNHQQVSIEATVEAVRDATLSTQVPGSIVNIRVKAGDRVQAGQVLLELDGRAAQQQVQGAQAQWLAARTQQTLAAQELERQRELFKKQYIAQAALDRAQAQFDAAKAQVQALAANTQAAQAQRGFFLVRAPFSGVISQVPVSVGDMAMPGRPLVVMHDPSALRVRGALPQTLKGAAERSKVALRYEVPGVSSGLQSPASVELIPAVDAATHTMDLRLLLSREVTGLTPGMHARIWLPAPEGVLPKGLWLPTSAVVRRGEMTGIYVLNAQGQPLLRQVRLGREEGQQVEVLSGVKAGESVVTQPELATRRAH